MKSSKIKMKLVPMILITYIIYVITLGMFNISRNESFVNVETLIWSPICICLHMLCYRVSRVKKEIMVTTEIAYLFGIMLNGICNLLQNENFVTLGTMQKALYYPAIYLIDAYVFIAKDREEREKSLLNIMIALIIVYTLINLKLFQIQIEEMSVLQLNMLEWAEMLFLCVTVMQNKKLKSQYYSEDFFEEEFWNEPDEEE